MRANKGGEYYSKFDEIGECPGQFANFLESWVICALYIMYGTLHQNSVAER